MKFSNSLILGKIQKRYKRFFADVMLENGSLVVAHVPNTGSMQGTWEINGLVALLPNNDPARKLQYTLVMSFFDGVWIGLHTGLTNKLVEEFLITQKEKRFKFQKLNKEVTIGKSRIDFCLETETGLHYIEVKNVTLVNHTENQRIALFPDSVTARGLKHLEELSELSSQGIQTTIFFCIQRNDPDTFMSAKNIDPAYTKGLTQAHKKGVHIYCAKWDVNPDEIQFLKSIPWIQ